MDTTEMQAAPTGGEGRRSTPGDAVQPADRILVWLFLLTLVFGGFATTAVVFGADAVIKRAAGSVDAPAADDHAGMHPAEPTAADDHAGMHPVEPTAADGHAGMHPAEPTGGDTR